MEVYSMIEVYKIDEDGIYLEPVDMESVPTIGIDKVRQVPITVIDDETKEESIAYEDQPYTEQVQKLYFEVEKQINEDETIIERFVTVIPPQGLYVLKWDGEAWVEGKPQYEVDEIKFGTIEQQKEMKLNELRRKCSLAIYDGFTSVKEYEFGMNEHDQMNFTQQVLRLIQRNADLEDIVHWKTKNNGVVQLTVKEFYQVIDDSEAHKLTQQAKFWQLEGQLSQATTKDEIDSIVW